MKKHAEARSTTAATATTSARSAGLFALRESSLKAAERLQRKNKTNNAPLSIQPDHD
jgi:phosphopantetheinyl transferase (holo-ACP synthase)